jgi:hypothetical protein
VLLHVWFTQNGLPAPHSPGTLHSTHVNEPTLSLQTGVGVPAQAVESVPLHWRQMPVAASQAGRVAVGHWGAGPVLRSPAHATHCWFTHTGVALVAPQLADVRHCTQTFWVVSQTSPSPVQTPSLPALQGTQELLTPGLMQNGDVTGHSPTARGGPLLSVRQATHLSRTGSHVLPCAAHAPGFVAVHSTQAPVSVSQMGNPEVGQAPATPEPKFPVQTLQPKTPLTWLQIGRPGGHVLLPAEQE